MFNIIPCHLGLLNLLLALISCSVPAPSFFNVADAPYDGRHDLGDDLFC